MVLCNPEGQLSLWEKKKQLHLTYSVFMGPWHVASCIERTGLNTRVLSDDIRHDLMGIWKQFWDSTDSSGMVIYIYIYSS